MFKPMFNPHFGWLLPMFSGLAKLSATRPRGHAKARGLSIEGKPVRAMWARPKDGARWGRWGPATGTVDSAGDKLT